MLATLAAVSVAVSSTLHGRSGHFTSESNGWPSLVCVAVAAMRRSLLIGLVGAVLIVALVARRIRRLAGAAVLSGPNERRQRQADDKMVIAIVARSRPSRDTSIAPGIIGATEADE